MEVQFLGTGSSLGTPVIGCKCDVCNSVDPRDERLRSSILIAKDDQTFLIDAGPDFRQQILDSRITHLTAILITHEHKDHVSGLDGVRPFNYLQKQVVELYAEKRVLENIKTKELYYAFQNTDYKSPPKLHLNEIENKEFSVGNTKILPIRGLHKNLPIFGYRIDNLAYITDMSNIEDEEKSKLQNLEVLIINALRLKKHRSHFSLAETLEIIKEVKPKTAYLTHISHEMGSYRELLRMLPDNVFPAYDRLTIEV